MGFSANRRSSAFNSPNGTSRNRPQSDLRLTECKVCDEGIFASESRVWATKILPSFRSGLVHSPICAQQEGVTTVGQPVEGGQRKYRT